MSKKRKQSSHEDYALVDLKNMTHRDLQRACVVRGMPFEQVISFSDPKLAGWFQDNYAANQAKELLDHFDTWRENQIREEHARKGMEIPGGLFHPNLRLGYVGEKDPETGEQIIKRPKGIKKPKKDKKERDSETKLFKGTKKDLTYQLTREGQDIEEIWKQVSKKFPDAKEKSVRIWNNRCKKEMKDAKSAEGSKK